MFCPALAVLVALAVLLVESLYRADDERPAPILLKDLLTARSRSSSIYAIVNRGYDAYQLRSDKAFGQTRSSDVENVWGTLEPVSGLAAHARQQNGWARSRARSFRFPRSASTRAVGAELHVFISSAAARPSPRCASGSSRARAAHPRDFASAAALYAAAFVNESVENWGRASRVQHRLHRVDLWVFDLGGIVLFSFEAVRRFTSEVVTISDWSLQPAITLPARRPAQRGQLLLAEGPLPFQSA